MKKEFKALLLLVAALTAGPAASFQNSRPAPPAAPAFPAAYLEGTDDFNLALQVQGDLRGSYGPCG